MAPRDKIGGGGAAPGPWGPNAGAARYGCVGLLGLVLLVMLAGMFADDESAPSPEPFRGNTLYIADTAPAPPAGEDAEEFYVHATMNVRSGPGEEHPVLRTVERGERVRLGPKDADGWAAVYPTGGAGGPAGYLYRASDQVRPDAPPAADSSPRRAASAGGGGRRSGAAGRGYHLGPRGGCYTYSEGGRKRYVDRSFCD